MSVKRTVLTASAGAGSAGLWARKPMMCASISSAASQYMGPSAPGTST